MTDPKKPHAFRGKDHPYRGYCECGLPLHDPSDIHNNMGYDTSAWGEQPINPHEGASPAVDASGAQPAWHAEYASRDPEQLEPYFTAHLIAMTDYQLESKAEIAEELAWRDQKLDAQAAEIAKAATLCKKQADLIVELQDQIDSLRTNNVDKAQAWNAISEKNKQNAALREALQEHVVRCPMCASGQECLDDLCAQDRAALKGTSDECPRLTEKAARQWARLSLDLEKQNAALREALQPFALFFSALKRATDIDEDDHLEPVLKMGHQALTVGAFVNALAALKGTSDE